MFWAFIFIMLMVALSMWSKSTAGGKDVEISYSDLYNQVKQAKVADAEVQGAELHGHMKATPKEQFHTHVGDHFEGLEAAFLASDAHFSKKEPQSNILLQLLTNLGPFVLLIGIWFFFMRQMQVRRQQGALVRQEPRAPALDAAEEDHLQRRCRRG